MTSSDVAQNRETTGVPRRGDIVVTRAADLVTAFHLLRTTCKHQWKRWNKTNTHKYKQTEHTHRHTHLDTHLDTHKDTTHTGTQIHSQKYTKTRLLASAHKPEHTDTHWHTLTQTDTLTHLHTYTHTQTYTNFAFTHTETHTQYTHTETQVHSQKYTDTRLLESAHTHTNSSTLTNLHTLTRLHTHTRTRTHLHTLTLTHTHTHTHTLKHKKRKFCVYTHKPGSRDSHTIYTHRDSHTGGWLHDTGFCPRRTRMTTRSHIIMSTRKLSTYMKMIIHACLPENRESRTSRNFLSKRSSSYKGGM